VFNLQEVIMLISTRRVNEKLIIGTDIVVTVLAVKGNRVCIGIEAPEDISVYRDNARIQSDQES
jgi:carbon storage regulator